MGRTFLKHFIEFAVFGMVFCGPVLGADEVGKVVSIAGKVMARIELKDVKGAGAKVRFLKPADSVFHGDVINTDSNGSVKILFKDQSIMDIGQSSLFKVDRFEHTGSVEDRKIEMSLGYGKIRAAINQKVGTLGKFKIKTRAATMGVRGTEFYVMSEMESTAGQDPEGAKEPTPRTRIVVTEGKVEVQEAKVPGSSMPAPKPVELIPGEKFTAILDQLEPGETNRAPASVSPVEKVAPEEMKTIVQDVKLKDATFAQAISIESPESSAPAGSGSSGAPGSFAGAETMAVIKETLLATPEIRAPAPPPGGFGVPGGPAFQPAFNGNFLPGFITAPLVRLNVIIKP